MLRPISDLAAPTPPADVLRFQLADELLAGGAVTTSEVERAVRTVPREAFVPEGTSLVQAYANDVVITQRLRRGEAVGLRDADVDLDAKMATIAQQITCVAYKPVTKDVKSDAGDRIIPLDTVTIAILRVYRARRNQWQLLSGATWANTAGLFFVTPDGAAWHPEQVTNRFEILVRDAGLPPIRLHDLRHCAATYLKASGADIKEIQETLGHASSTITSDTYTSVILEMESEIAKADAAVNLIPRTDRKAS
jgi:integrase